MLWRCRNLSYFASIFQVTSILGPGGDSANLLEMVNMTRKRWFPSSNLVCRVLQSSSVPAISEMKCTLEKHRLILWKKCDVHRKRSTFQNVYIKVQVHFVPELWRQMIWKVLLFPIATSQIENMKIFKKAVLWTVLFGKPLNYWRGVFN